jgi:hypothetical protein
MAPRASLLAAGLLLALALPGLSRAEDPEIKVTIDAEDEPLIGVVKKLCAARGLDYVVSESALQRAGHVSLKLTDVPLTVALETICEVYGLDAHLRGRIVVIKLHEGTAAAAPAPAPRHVEEPLLPRPSHELLPPAPPAAPAPTTVPTPAPAPGPVAEVTSQTQVPMRSVASSGGGGIVVGSVVDIAADSVTVKEDRGEPRVFLVAPGSDDDGRNLRLLQALKRLHKGDRIALECKTEGSKTVVVNLVGGGKPQ